MRITSTRTGAVILGLLLTAVASSVGVAHADSQRHRSAERTGVTAEVLALLDSDPAVRLDPRGRVFFADHRTATPPGPEQPARAVAPFDRTFRLHSRPGSQRTLYIDVDSERVCDTAWNQGGLLGPILGGSLPCATQPGWFSATSAGDFTRSQLSQIQEVWARVSEDFSTFDIDVTTERPPDAAISRSHSGDKQFGVHAVVTSSTSARNATCGGPGCAGVAYLGVFPDPSANDARILWAFPEEVGDSPRILADIISHETGHTLGLNHDGQHDLEYFGGHGIWAPIMGSGTRHLTQWSRGEYAGATEQQDDLAVMARHGIAHLRDDHGNKPRSGTKLRRKKQVTGIIGSATDVDAFRFRTTCRGTVRVRARTATHGPNLDVLLAVKRPGKRFRTVNPLTPSTGVATGLNASWRGKGKRGAWKVRLRGTGARNPADTGYSAYGSIGAYTLKVTGRCVKR